MSWRFGDEYMPRLRVRMAPSPVHATSIIGVGLLPPNHPLRLALDVLVAAGAERDDVSARVVDWLGGFCTFVTVTDQALRAHPNAHALIQWYERNQHVLNQPNRRSPE